MKYRFLFLSLLLLAGIFQADPAKAQEILTLQEAVKIALERNYDIKLAQNNLAIDKLNESRANAGMLPFVDANLTNIHGIQNSSQTQADGTIRERNGARSSSLNYGVGLNWTIFDGFGMFARYDQLQELRKIGETELQQTILARVGDVMSTYYNLIQQQQQLKAYDSAILISRMRLNIAQNRFTIGKAARLAVLNAQVDLNTDTTNLLRQRELYANTRVQLNELLARDVNIQFRVEDSIRIDDQLKLDQLYEMASQQNPSLRAAIIGKRVAQLELKRVKANRYPLVGVNSGYTFTESQSVLGFTTQASGRGLTYGITASVPLYNGGLQRRNEKIAGILIDNSRLEYERLNQNILSQLSTSFQTYQTSLSLVNLENNNRDLARKNLEITMEKYRLGSITPVEFRDAQLNFLNADVRYSNAQYQAKLAEISLRELAGNLNL